MLDMLLRFKFLHSIKEHWFYLSLWLSFFLLLEHLIDDSFNIEMPTVQMHTFTI